MLVHWTKPTVGLLAGPPPGLDALFDWREALTGDGTRPVEKAEIAARIAQVPALIVRARQLRSTAPLLPEDDDMPATTTSRDSRYANVFVEPWGGTLSSLPAGQSEADEVFTHDGRLASCVWRAWGCTIQEAIDRGLLVSS